MKDWVIAWVIVGALVVGAVCAIYIVDTAGQRDAARIKAEATVEAARIEADARRERLEEATDRLTEACGR